MLFAVGMFCVCTVCTGKLGGEQIDLENCCSPRCKGREASHLIVSIGNKVHTHRWNVRARLPHHPQDSAEVLWVALTHCKRAGTTWWFCCDILLKMAALQVSHRLGSPSHWATMMPRAVQSSHCGWQEHAWFPACVGFEKPLACFSMVALSWGHR